MRETTRKDDTRQRLIEAGAEILHRQGYAGTGIQQVLDACGVPKGSFYHYFRSKEDFALAVVDFHAGRMVKGARALFADPARTPLERLRHFFAYFLGCFADQAHPLGQSGCPIGNLVQELAAGSPVFQQRLNEVLCDLEQCMADMLREARAAGETNARLDPEETARFISSSWQGAILRAKAAGDCSPLVRARDFILQMLAAS
ncbi:MAG: TetR/AcrR family transcriptional regulator [Proteobacteria bacterium]|nr:TetR/AcrR family transcriptional regulator [Pseudomonadota bacterium]MBU1595624.1 TetR/AcrR family transcriptional regulator [Pseudomonadota bacterium]